MSDQKKQTKSTDSKIIVGDVSKLVDAHKQQNKQVIAMKGSNGSVTVDVKDVAKNSHIDNSSRINLPNKRLMIFIGIVILIIFVLIIGYVLIRAYERNQSSLADTSINGIANQHKAVEVALATANKDNAHQLVASLGSDAKNVKNTKQRAQYYSAMAQIELNYGNPTFAIGYAQQAKSLDASAANYGLLGYSAMAANNYKLAAESFAKAASLSAKTDPDARSPYNDYLELEKQAKAKV